MGAGYFRRPIVPKIIVARRVLKRRRSCCSLVYPRAGYVYSITGGTKLGWGLGTLIGTGPDVYMKWRGVSSLLILAVLVATILAGCAGTGSGDSSQTSEEQQTSRSAGSTQQKTEGAGSSGQASAGPARASCARESGMRPWF